MVSDGLAKRTVAAAVLCVVKSRDLIQSSTMHPSLSLDLLTFKALLMYMFSHHSGPQKEHFIDSHKSIL